MKYLILILIFATSAFATENKDLKCSLTRYTSKLSGGEKVSEETKGVQNQIIKWELNRDQSNGLSFEIDGINMSASVFSQQCWDDDRMVECNQRILMLYVLNRSDDSNISNYYDLNQAAASAKMGLVFTNEKGRYEISCEQQP